MNKIQTVKIQGQSYLLNGTMSVPKADGNSEYELIKQWIAEGNTPEPEFTEEELQVQTTAKAKAEALAKISSLEASQLRSIRELMLDPTNAYAKAKLEDIEAQIQAERTKL